MSVGIFGCHNWGGELLLFGVQGIEAKDAAKHLTIHRTNPQFYKEVSGPKCQ